MNLITPETRIDPLRAFIVGGFVAGTPRPVPLVATRFDVLIDGGLAAVTTSRTFRNAESESIEATITFPVPVHATLFALKARIGDRVLNASAKRKDTACEDYEGALECGKTAVLHEEVLRGVHMLSVGHVAPGAEIEVQSTFAVVLTNLNGRGTLRIPLTVGDIYGRSGLPDSDDLAQGGPMPLADLAVECLGGSAVLIGGALEEGRAKVGLDAPIDLEVIDWSPRDLIGRAADGRTVTLRIERTAAGEVPLDVAILVDHSSSMDEACSSDRPRQTKHKVLVDALGRVARTVEKADMIDLWEFDDALTFIGSTRPVSSRPASPAGLWLRVTGRNDLGKLVRALSGPRGGTEIGGSLDRVLAQSTARDVLLITDGKSHALDVQALAQRGRRISVVLVGEDSLEANVGHLAALTGGEIFVATGDDLVAALESAVRSLKVPHQAAAPMDGSPQRVAVRRGGMTISAQWQPTPATTGDALTLRAAAAMAASLALPAMATESAAQFAEAEGLVTHLTSLILIDEAATQEASIPATRKVGLPRPRTAAMVEQVLALRADILFAPQFSDARCDEFAQSLDEPAVSKPQRDRFNGGDLAVAIGWDQAPHRLQIGDLVDLDPTVTRAIRDIAARSEIIELARKLAIDPLVLVIGLLARMQAYRNRSAKRIARAIFGKRPPREVDEAAAMAGFQ